MKYLIYSTFIDIARDSIVTDANENWHVTVFVASLEAEPGSGIQMHVVLKDESLEKTGRGAYWGWGSQIIVGPGLQQFCM